MSWLTPGIGPDGQQALDVLIVGGGESGVAIACALLRARVSNILAVDKAPSGQEGPWLTYACMPTLRSPKEYTGPDLDLPNLGYQAWHEARHGAADWQALANIAREDWAAYLGWVRDTAGVPVLNEVEVVDIAEAAGGLLAIVFRDGMARYARKIELATGQEGGGWWKPDFVAALPVEFRAPGGRSDRLWRATGPAGCGAWGWGVGVRQRCHGAGDRRAGGCSVLPAR